MILKLSPNIFLSTGVTIANSKSENQKKSQQRKRFDKFLRIKYFTIIRSSSVLLGYIDFTFMYTMI